MTNHALEVDVHDHVFDLDSGEQLKAIEKVAFSLKADSFTCVVGPSGCGKTTLLRLILGLERKFNGRLEILCNGPVSAVFQEPRLLPWRTVEQNVRLVLPKQRQHDSLHDLFDVLGLSEMRDLYPGQLSTGLARRVSLARALVTEPQLLILDEPFVSLDSSTADRLRGMLMGLWRTRPTTVLMVTHDTAEAALLADSVIVFTPRPARVAGVVTIETPRESREASYLVDIQNRIGRLSAG